jgi:hypothetical protein
MKYIYQKHTGMYENCPSHHYKYTVPYCICLRGLSNKKFRGGGAKIALEYQTYIRKFEEEFKKASARESWGFWGGGWKKPKVENITQLNKIL